MDELIRYDVLVENAMRGVVREALKKLSKKPENNKSYFIITFDTKHKDTIISDNIRKKYPNEITIILQHQFFNLKVFQKYFEVDLSFSGTLEKIRIPFEAITIFIDPTINFQISFKEDFVVDFEDEDDVDEYEEDDYDDEEEELQKQKNCKKTDNIVNLDIIRKQKKV